ncbi:MAG: molecular chaperone DnaJ [Alphaproteobacteria bacterium]|nr:molecular chaperone DnaJ [Alphaproteobacteria bacterium]|tara:strand:- start:2018 stop:2605 length:588 start_codon:yes stop_codon:yes gene_type:complete
MPPSKLKNFSPAQSVRVCDHPECDSEGEFRAPKSPHDLDSYFWFCLDHVRAYNSTWNYFDGMSQNDIERFQKSAVTWHRPTWPFATDSRKGAARDFSPDRDFFGSFRDDYGVLWGEDDDTVVDESGQRRRITSEERRALAELNLDSDADLQQIKDRYKELVKKFHPDANGGSKKAEERLKAVNQAYGFLLSSGYT